MEKIILLSYIPLGIVCIFRPMLFLYLFLSIPLYEYIPVAVGDFSSLKMFQIGPINVFLWDYLLLMLFIYFLVNVYRKNPRLYAAATTPISLVVLLYFLWEVFISILSYYKGFELQNILRNLAVESLTFMAVLVALINPSEVKKERLMQFTVLLSVLVVLFAILKYGIFHEVQYTSSATRRTLTGNAVIILLFPLCYVLYYRRFWISHGWATLFFVALVAVGIHFAGHRSGWIAFFFVTGVWFIFQQPKMRLAWVPMWGIALAVTLVMFATSADLKSGTIVGDFFIRIADTVDTENATTQERLSKWKLSLDTIAQNPFLGLGRFPVYTRHIGENEFLAQSFSELDRAPHNLIAAKAVHEGLLGLSMLAIFFFIIFRQLAKSRLDDKPLSDFLKVFIIAFLIYSLFNPVFTNETGRIYFFAALGFLNAEYMKNFRATDTETWGHHRRTFASAG